MFINNSNNTIVLLNIQVKIIYLTKLYVFHLVKLGNSSGRKLRLRNFCNFPVGIYIF